MHEIAGRLNNDPLIKSFTRIEVVAWDWGSGVPLEALASPQESVNRHLALPEDCEVFVGIFRCKLGTPLPTKEFRKIDGTPFFSGSEYEFHRAWDARRRGASRPAILIYRQDIPKGSCPDAAQYENLQSFFGQPPFKSGGQWTGSLNRYTDPADFQSRFESHLRVLLHQHHPGVEQSFEVWLKRQATALTSNAGPRYTGNAHLETDIGEVFDWLLARQSAINALDEALGKVWKEIERDAAFADERKSLEVVAENLRKDVYWQTTPDLQLVLNTMKDIENKGWNELEAHDRERENSKKLDEHGHRSFHLRQAAIHARHATELLESYAGVSHKRVLLLIGPAGQGKTHTVVHEINRTLHDGGIAVGVLGQTLGAGGDLWAAIRSKLEWNGTTEQLLDKLENEAINRKQRALIVIDALNETPNRNRWRAELAGMIGEVNRRPHLALVISVRTDYLRHVLPETREGEAPSWVMREHPGFAGIEPDALLRYFEFFGVKAPVAPPLGEFGNPLYVQLLAKSLKGKQLKHWLPSWLEVWEAWMGYLEQEAQDKSILSDPSRVTPIRRTMSKLAQAMLDEGRFSISRKQSDEIAKQTAGADGVIGFLCSAGALIDRLDDDDEVVEFGFERLSDTFLADRLLDNLFNGLDSKKEKQAALSKALANGGMLFPLVSREWMDHPLCYRRSGLLEALCLAAPQHIGAEFPSLIPEEQEHGDFPFWELNNAFTDSLRWRSKPEEFGADSHSLFEMWKERTDSDRADELIRLALIPDHPFAMERIIHPRLLEKENPGARDALWSVDIARMWSDTWTLGQLVKWACDAQLHGIHVEVALPAAQSVVHF
ncbi:MAG: ATP-binding protein [Anaerolineae bacterium]|nr:ATP-binding protein [Anaerolineae bacterium]